MTITAIRRGAGMEVLRRLEAGMAVVPRRRAAGTGVADHLQAAGMANRAAAAQALALIIRRHRADGTAAAALRREGATRNMCRRTISGATATDQDAPPPLAVLRKLRCTAKWSRWGNTCLISIEWFGAD